MKGNPRSSGYQRADHEWYVEPRRAIDLLLDVEPFTGVVWDPACGGGNIPNACKDRGLEVLGTDLVSRSPDYPLTSDFLYNCSGNPSVICTNPPFLLAEAFIHRSLSLATYKVAVLVRTMFLEGQGRHKRLFKPKPPARIWQFAPRISMPPGGTNIPARNGSIAYCWIVWAKDYTGPTTFGWLA